MGQAWGRGGGQGVVHRGVEQLRVWLGRTPLHCKRAGAAWSEQHQGKVCPRPYL